ncbi:hypothetical protein NPIL_669591, partial [Nephila pilipes]
GRLRPLDYTLLRLYIIAIFNVTSIWQQMAAAAGSAMARCQSLPFALAVKRHVAMAMEKGSSGLRASRSEAALFCYYNTE